MPNDEQSNPDKRKQSLYFPDEMLEEIRAEADRMGTSMSRVIQDAWRRAREVIKRYPGADG